MLFLDLDSFATEFPFPSWMTAMTGEPAFPVISPSPNHSGPDVPEPDQAHSPQPPPPTNPSSSCSDGPDPTRFSPPLTNSNSGSDGPDLALEERRVRRKISNRDSARRSRMKKQQHLEDLRTQAERLRASNRDLAARLGNVAQHCLLFRRDNERLRHEYASLSRRLRDLLAFWQLQTLTAGPPPVFHGNEMNVMGGVGLMI